MKNHKIKFLFVTFLATACYIIISGYKEGPAQFGGWECTGAETGLGNHAGCAGSGGCHSSSPTAGISVVLELDSTGGVPTNHYTGGLTYTVKITGTNNTSNNLPKFGFQIGCIKGPNSQITPTNAGTWPAPYPGGTHYAGPQATFYVVGVVEHATQLAPSSGSGGNGTVYSESFKWVAPVASTGTVSFWAALNAVNNNGNADAGDLWNNAYMKIPEWGNFTGVISVEQNSFNVNVYPNPVTEYASLDYTLAETANVQIALYDITGRQVSSMVYNEQSAGEHHQTLNIPELNLKKGIYILVINDGNSTDSRKLIVQ